MGSPILWVDMLADRDLMQNEEENIQAFCLPDLADEAACLDRCVYFGWARYEKALAVISKIVAATPDINWKVVLDWDECDAPGDEVLYFGPKALELELEDVIREVEILEARRERLCELIEAREANA